MPFYDVIVAGAALGGVFLFMLNVKEEEKPSYEAEREYYNEHRELPPYMYEVMVGSGLTEEQVKKLIGVV